MALGTYDESRWGVLDKLRVLFTDNEVTEGTTVVPEAILSDVVYTKVLADNGIREGGALLATMYANHYATQVPKQFGDTLAGTTVTFADMVKQYNQMAADIRSGKIVIEAISLAGRGVLRGQMVAGNKANAYHEAYGVWSEQRFLD